jgi:hypothetical protein
MDEGVLIPELPGGPFSLQRMGPSLLSTPVCTAPGEVPPSTGNRRRSRPLPLARSAREEGDKPDRWAPPVGVTTQPPVALALEYVFSASTRTTGYTFSVAGKRIRPRTVFFLFYLKLDLDLNFDWL